MIKREVVNEILLRNDIESLIGSYVNLKRAGSNLKGLCPFHNEKTPSFTVYPADNSFYCFGCGIGGNAITFVRQMEHLDYRDALEFLAKRAGLSVILDSDDRGYQQKRTNKARMIEMNVEAGKFFHYSLIADNPKSKEALRYLTDIRGLSLATIKHFGLGYAPDSFDSLLNYMTKKGYNKEELVEAFLVSKNDRGNYYDAFRNRIVFPIIDVSGNLIAFTGRRLVDDKNIPKYKNTMDTAVYKKSRNVYALNFAKNSGEDFLILCEGTMDAIAMHASGFTNAIAPLGTAFTEEQARLISRYTKKVVTAYDSDEAGQKATAKAIKILDSVGVAVSVIKIPGEKDPDEYIKKYGKEKFSELLKSSESKFEYTMETVLSRYNLNLPQDKIDALTEIEKLISKVYLKAERDIYIQNVAERFGADPKSIKDDVERLARREAAIYRKNESDKLKQKSVGYTDRINPDFAKSPALARCEENLLGLLIMFPEHRKAVFSKELVSSDDFFTDLNKRIFLFIEEKYKAGLDDMLDFNEAFEPEEQGRIKGMKIRRMELQENGAEVLDEAIAALKHSMEKNNAKLANSIEDLNKIITTLQNKNKGS